MPPNSGTSFRRHLRWETSSPERGRCKALFSARPPQSSVLMSLLRRGRTRPRCRLRVVLRRARRDGSADDSRNAWLRSPGRLEGRTVRRPADPFRVVAALEPFDEVLNLAAV